MLVRLKLCIGSHIWSDTYSLDVFSCFFHVFQTFGSFPSRIRLPTLSPWESSWGSNIIPGLLISKSHQCQAFWQWISVSRPRACIHLSLPLSSANFHSLSFLRRTILTCFTQPDPELAEAMRVIREPMVMLESNQKLTIQKPWDLSISSPYWELLQLSSVLQQSGFLFVES